MRDERAERAVSFFEGRAGRALAWALAAGGLIATLGVGRPLIELGNCLSAGGAPGVVALELAFTAGRAEGILGEWRVAEKPPDRLALARQSLELDLWFIPSYTALLVGLLLLVLPAFRPERRRGWLLFSLLPLFAGAADVVEDLCLLPLVDLFAAERPLDGRLAAAAGVAAAIKFLLVLLALVALVGLLVAALRRRTGRTHLFEGPATGVVGFASVFAGELAYLRERRAQAGLPPKCLDQTQPIGLTFSGGGIRSATVNLGALQGLARLDLLGKVDYLSTVSGGGYIGSTLSSLLSINRRKIDLAASGVNDQYLFAPDDQPYFSVATGRFPFEPDPLRQPDLAYRPTSSGQQPEPPPERFDGRTQLEHLRTFGDFLIRRAQLFHRDVLRAVGEILGGLLYHLGYFVVFLAASAAVYLATVGWMIGPIPGYDRALSFTANLRAYGYEMLGRPESLGDLRPLLVAVLLGAVVLVAGMFVLGKLLWSLPDDWFRSRGQSIDEGREYQALWGLFSITLIVAVAVTGSYLRRYSPQLPFILLPLGVYLGGWAASLVLHALVAMSSRFDRNARSCFAAWKGIFDYLALASVVVIFFPLLIAWLNSHPSFKKGGAVGWLVSVVVGRLLAKAGAEAKKQPEGGRLARLAALPVALRKALLGVAVTVVSLAGALLIAAEMVRWEAGAFSLAGRWWEAVAWVGLFAFLGLLLDFNKLSLHYFYRDRLSEAYLQTLRRRRGGGALAGSLDLVRDNAEMPLTHLHGVPEGTPDPDREGPRDYLRRIVPGAGAAASAAARSERAQVCATAAPYHLIVACLNLTRSRDMTRRDRKSDSFIFSRLFCGSRTSGYLPTALYRGGETRLARAMAVSGAAASPAMGPRTFFGQAAAMTLFNVRLGQWMENPGYRNGSLAHRRENLVFWPKYLMKEVLASTDANDRLVYLSDGGHTGDNLGLYPLFQRRCRLILAFDAEADPGYSFGSLTEALRQVSIDFNVCVEIDLDPLRPDPKTGRSREHFALGRIEYPATTVEAGDPDTLARAAETGWLVVVKCSLTGDEPETVKSYRQEHPDFPQQTTGDQFFDDAQFEAYRALGDHMVLHALGKRLSRLATSHGCAGEWEKPLERLRKQLIAAGKPPAAGAAPAAPAAARRPRVEKAPHPG